MTIYSIFNDLTWKDPLTHPSTQPPTIHLSKGGSVFINHKSSNRIELSRLDQVLLKFLWFHMFRPTNPPIHPPTHPPKKTPTHGWGILHRFQIFKWNWNILICSSLIAFLLIWGVPPMAVGGWVGRGGVGWVGWGWVGWGHPHAHAHTNACMLNMINMAASMVAAICNFLTCLS